MTDPDRSIPSQPSTPRLTRPRRGRMVAGVCAGIARFFGWDPTLVRVVYAIGSFLSAAFPGILVYVILWLLMPADRGGARTFRV